MNGQSLQFKKKRTRLAAAASLAASEMGRMSSMMFAGLAAVTVEVTSHHLRDSSKVSFKDVHYYAFAAACPTFIAALFCFEKFNLGTWSQAVLAVFPWGLLIIAGGVALMPHPWWPVILVLVIATIAIDRWRLSRWSRSIELSAHRRQRQ
jgi:hypothetical protein